MAVDYAAWLEKRTAARVVVVEAMGSTMRYVASRRYITEPGDTPANTPFIPRLASRRDFDIHRRAGALFGIRSAGAVGDVYVMNQDGALNSWIEEDWSTIAVKWGDPSWAYSDFEDLLTEGRIADVELDRRFLRFGVRDLNTDLEDPAQVVQEWHGPNLGNFLPLCIGFPGNVSPVVRDVDDPDSLEYGVNEDGPTEDCAFARYVNQSPSLATIEKRDHIASVRFAADPGGLVTLDSKGIKDSGGTWIQYIGSAVKHLLTRSITDTIGIAVGGSANTIQFGAEFSDVDDFYNGGTVQKTELDDVGSDTREWRTVTDYVGATRIATVNTDWTTAAKDGDGCVMHDFAMQTGPFAVARVDTNALDDLDTLLPYVIGIYIDDGGSMLDWLTRILQPFGWHGWKRGALFSAGILKDPANETEDDLELTDRDIFGDVRTEKEPPPVWRMRVAYGENHTVQEGGAVDNIDINRQSYVTQRFRYQSKQNYAIKKAQEDLGTPARAVTIETKLCNDDAARALLDLLWPLFSVQRYRRYVTASAKAMQADLGSIVKLTSTRSSLAGVKHFCYGFRDMPMGIAKAELELWG